MGILGYLALLLFLLTLGIMYLFEFEAGVSFIIAVIVLIIMLVFEFTKDNSKTNSNNKIEDENIEEEKKIEASSTENDTNKIFINGKNSYVDSSLIKIERENGIVETYSVENIKYYEANIINNVEYITITFNDNTEVILIDTEYKLHEHECLSSKLRWTEYYPDYESYIEEKGKVAKLENLAKSYSLGEANILMILNDILLYITYEHLNNNIFKIRIDEYSKKYDWDSKNLYDNAFITSVLYSLNLKCELSDLSEEELYEKIQDRLDNFIILNRDLDNIFNIGFSDLYKNLEDFLELLVRGYKAKELAKSDSSFMKVLNKLKEENIDDAIICNKIDELFSNEGKRIFGYIYNAYNAKKLITYINVVLLREEIYNVKKGVFETYLSECEYTNIKDIIVNYPYELVIKNSETSVTDEMVYLIKYLLEKNRLSFRDFCFCIKNFRLMSNEIISSINKHKHESEISRILAGDLSQEKKETSELLDFSSVLNGFEFEEYLSRLYTKLGYKVEHTKLSGDQGADLLVEKDNIKSVVQAKFYTHPVGNKAIQEVVASKQYYDAQKAIVVCTSSFTKSAVELAKKNDVILVDKRNLKQMIEEVSKKLED